MGAFSHSRHRIVAKSADLCYSWLRDIPIDEPMPTKHTVGPMAFQVLNFDMRRMCALHHFLVHDAMLR